MVMTNLGRMLVNLFGKFSCFGAIILVALQYWNFFNLDNIHPNLVTGLYFYIITNAATATPFAYLEKRTKASIAKICPYCDSPLEKIPRYLCQKCGGTLEIKKE